MREECTVCLTAMTWGLGQGKKVCKWVEFSDRQNVVVVKLIFGLSTVNTSRVWLGAWRSASGSVMWGRVAVLESTSLVIRIGRTRSSKRYSIQFNPNQLWVPISNPDHLKTKESNRKSSMFWIRPFTGTKDKAVSKSPWQSPTRQKRSSLTQMLTKHKC